MRVLLLSQEMPPETAWGGIGTYVGALAPALAGLGAEVHVLSVVPDQPASDVVREGVAVHRRALRRLRGVGRGTGLPRTWNRLSLAAGVAHELRRLKTDFDVCESPEWNAEGLFAGTDAAMVVRLHLGARQVLPIFGHHGVDARLAARCEAALVRRADLITGTRAQLDTTLGRPWNQRAVAVGLPVPLPPSAASPTRRPRVVFVGRFERRKNPEVLIRAAPLVLKEFPAAEFVFIGRDTGLPDGGSYVALMHDLARRLDVAHAVRIVDAWTRPAELREAMAEAAVVAVPSRWESFGLVAAEASALGRAVVAGDGPALSDVVLDGRTGRLAGCDDVDAWASALSELLSSPVTAEAYGAAGREHIRRRFDPEQVAKDTLAAYALAIARKGAR